MDVLSSLELIDVEKICLHEEHEHTRLDQTSSSIAADGSLKHPPLAMKMMDGRYLILDGAHRTNALQKLGCKRIPLQIVDREEIQLGSWDHVVPMGAWFEHLRKEPTLRWEKERTVEAPIAEVITDQERFFLYENTEQGSLKERLSAWHLVVNGYRKDYAVKRLVSGTPESLEKGMVRFCYPAYTLGELETVVLSGALMPAGVTRVAVDGRLLNLNVPLSFLLSDSIVKAEWEQQKSIWTRSLRLYSEAVYLCEV